MAEEITPIRQQYLDIKRQYPEAILFFRLGDFYETFDHDAEITSRELDIVLTSRNVAKGSRIPMAGIPYHAAENYLSRLINKGYHVAICEQVGEQPVKGLFPRQVVRVVTPGTLVEPGLLASNKNNYLTSIDLAENKAGLAYADISTGEFFVTELYGDDPFSLLRTELTRLDPVEILMRDGQKLPWDFNQHLSPWPAWRFEINRCRDILHSHFKVSTLDGFGLRGLTSAICAAGALLQYIQETQPPALSNMVSLSTYSLDEFMTLDGATRRNLELTETIRDKDEKGSLLGTIDLTITPMGKRLIRQWVNKPLLDINLINDRQNKVTFLVKNGLLRAELRNTLKGLADVERLTTRVISGHALPRELVSLRNSLQIIPGLNQIFRDDPTALPDGFLDSHLSLVNLLKGAIEDNPPATLQNTGIIRRNYSAELDGVIEASQHAREWINSLESTERERTGIRTLKVGFNKVFGYFIEISNSLTSQAPENYIRKQTLVNAERYITPELKEYESLVLNAEERIREIEVKLFREICGTISSFGASLLKLARALAELDTFASLAETAAIYGYVRPEVTDDVTLEIRDGRHPVVEHLLSGERFVPNDAIFEPGEMIRLITGPNMSGKSTFLRQIALIVLLSQIGSYVPASSAKIGLVDRIFTRIGAQDEIHAGQSTFMVEMVETANILNHATNRSLLILDEIGRGTSTYDGVSIAWSTAEYLHNHPQLRSRTLFATHYHELTQLSELLPGIRNYNVAVAEVDGKVVFLHKIVPGGADRSYGIHVAQLAGLPHPVIQRASEILKQLELSSGKAVSINSSIPGQMALFPETNPIIEDLQKLDINTISPIEALNKLFEWKRKFSGTEKE